MTIEYLFLIFMVEIILFIAAIYMLVKADNWIKQKTVLTSDNTPKLYDLISNFRFELKTFNRKHGKNKEPKPLNPQELSIFAKELVNDFAKSFIPGFSFKRRFLIFKIFLKVLKNKNRLKATLNSF